MAADAKRIAEILEVLSSFTDVPGEITRPTYAHAWREALIYLAGEMRTVGMETRVDCAQSIGRYNPAMQRARRWAWVRIWTLCETAVLTTAQQASRRGWRGVHEEDLNPPAPGVDRLRRGEAKFSKGCLGSEYHGHTPLKLSAH